MFLSNPAIALVRKLKLQSLCIVHLTLYHPCFIVEEENLKNNNSLIIRTSTKGMPTRVTWF